MEQNRREFLQAALSVPVLYSATRASAAFQGTPPSMPDQFLFGASVYPELQTREGWNSMLDHFQSAHMNTVRVSESSWGNLEIAPGEYNFGWLRAFLDDLENRKMKAILGTSSYIPPQWLVAEHPEVLLQPLPGYTVDPMSRKMVCLNHPQYRTACGRYISAIGKEFKDHPAVIGWQLDNEIEFMIARICYNPVCKKAWHDWLQKMYRTPQQLNLSLDLVSWGMKISSFEEVPQPRLGAEELGTYVEFTSTKNARRHLPALGLAHLHFRRDVILGFLAEQMRTLRQAGVEQWITTDWNTVWLAIADDPEAGKILNIAGLNYYQPKEDDPQFWATLTWHQDMHRSVHNQGHFITTENRFGTIGQTFMDDPFPVRDQFQMWGLEAAAFGTSGLLYWSGNRWKGGHWPQWGGLLDWSGHPEPDFGWAVGLGEFFSKWGKYLLDHPVKATAVVLTDFDQRATLDVYPHIKASLSLLPQSFYALHRLGIGVDTMNLKTAENADRLERYSLVIIPAATALDNIRVSEALIQYVRKGGVVVITPFTAYTDWNGIFRGDGFGATLRELTGTVVRTIRWMGSTSANGKHDPAVKWKSDRMSGIFPVALDGYCEFMELDPDVETIGVFQSAQAILNGKPAVVQKKHSQGTAIKLGFWPQDETFIRLTGGFIREKTDFLAQPTPPGVMAVPRTDSSLFIINTTSRRRVVGLRKQGHDRVSDKTLQGVISLRPYQVLWLE